MTSIELLKDIQENYSLEMAIFFKGYFETIKKDLDVLVVLKDLFDFDFALRFPSNQPMLKITNKRTNEYWEIAITQEKYDLLKEVFRNE